MTAQSSLAVMQFEDQAVRMTYDENGEPWWVLADVCQALEHTNSRVAASRLDEDEKGVSIVYTLGGQQEVTIVNEPGLYSLIMTSRKPVAKRFKRWVTHEVLPAIRQTGGYSLDQGANPFADVSARIQIEIPEYLPPFEHAVWLKDVQQVKQLYGPAAARRLREESPLPRVYLEGARPPASGRTGEAALMHLLASRPADYPDMSLFELISLSPRNLKMKVSLARLGLAVNPDGVPDVLAVATDHPAIVKRFARTRWAADWVDHMLHIAGARRADGVVNFDGTDRPAILIPGDAVAHFGYRLVDMLRSDERELSGHLSSHWRRA